MDTAIVIVARGGRRGRRRGGGGRGRGRGRGGGGPASATATPPRSGDDPAEQYTLIMRVTVLNR